MINDCLKDTAKVCRSDYDLPFFFFLQISISRIFIILSSFLPLENILILSTTIKTRTPTVECGKIEGKNPARKKVAHNHICNVWLF